MFNWLSLFPLGGFLSPPRLRLVPGIAATAVVGVGKRVWDLSRPERPKESLRPGDHIYSYRAYGSYSHHGLYCGDGQVIHYSGFCDGLSSGPIEMTSLDGFLCGNNLRLWEYPARDYGPQESVERARSRLGEDAYSLFRNNCEHFVTWCITGEARSDQVAGIVEVIIDLGPG